ncbi:hypothetical protein Ahy_B08g093071 isoform E [Arachis hypogaea]|uniref:Uncharacterized protein n=1 Tax=Arachis hypogaea TaxID=3818 RepID=A0A444Y588_ARAHY|nr:hypothetical protein Ahy_B08g093071 isoform E [Arachis hypogaea]
MVLKIGPDWPVESVQPKTDTKSSLNSQAKENPSLSPSPFPGPQRCRYPQVISAVVFIFACFSARNPGNCKITIEAKNFTCKFESNSTVISLSRNGKIIVSVAQEEYANNGNATWDLNSDDRVMDNNINQEAIADNNASVLGDEVFSIMVPVTILMTTSSHTQWH